MVQTDHSSLRHLPNQPSVNRCMWKWVSILQGYDIEIRHIPGKVNIANALTRQVKCSALGFLGTVFYDWVSILWGEGTTNDGMRETVWVLGKYPNDAV